MFQKPAFGANTSGFGMQSTFGASTSTASPFGGFKPAAAAGAFGAPPAFGAAGTAQPTTGGGLFGSSTTTGGLFGATSAPAPSFGAPAGFSFGASTGGGGLFAGGTTPGLFGGTQQTNAFGSKPAGGFGFGSTTTNQNQSSGLFGATSTAGTSLFGQQTSTLGGGGLFSSTAGGFGQQQQTGTGHVKYNPVVGTDVVVKSGASQTINIKHHCITCMKEYESKSLEELRLEDYTAGRKGASGGMFPLQQQQGAKPLFGGSTTFGQPATTSAPSVFGGGTLTTGGAFGQNNSFSFGSNTQTSTNTSGLFGGNKPTFGATTAAGTGLFGAPATTQPPAFGTNTSSAFGFGTTLQNQTTGGGLFGAKPAASAFGAAPASSGFGFGGGLFAAKPLQTQAPTFGAPQPGIGTQALGFGSNTSTSGGLFGAGTFGKPPQAAAQPTFGFGNAQQPLTGGGGLGGNAFQNKSTTQPFGGSMFQAPNTNTFRTGLDSGLGGGMFGNNSALGGSALGLGVANNTSIANLSGWSAAGNVHEQILALAARPYGDSPLFKDLLPDSSTTAEDVLKPTNPAAMKAVLDRSAGAYRAASPTDTRLRLRPPAAARDKKSLFDGLEESDASLEDKLSLKPSRKRLVLRPNQRNDSHNDSGGEAPAASYRSVEEQTSTRDVANTTDKENAPVPATTANNHYTDSNNLDASSDRQGSWLSSSKLSWSENKEKSIDNEPTPRLYPSLEKDLPAEGSERRASWLTTKPLRKPLSPPAQCPESSVRELAVRGAPTPRSTTLQDDDGDGGRLDGSPPSAPPHPAGVKLTRPGYYTIPSLEEMLGYMRSDGTCVVPHLTIGRTNYGNVYYDSEVNVTGLDLDELVHFLNKEVIVYPEDADKPPVGEGLNKRAIVTLDRIWPRDKTENKPITDPDRLWEYERKLRRVCEKHNTKFIEYRPQTGSWVFRVEHFSKYGLTDSDEEDDITPEVMRRQITIAQQLQQSAPHGVKPPVSAASVGLGGLSSPGLGGLGSPGLVGMGSPGLGVSLSGLAGSDNILAMQQVSLNLLNGARTFEMETTEDNAESQSLYQDHKAFGVRSPTSELARLESRRSHHVQLMKASLYADMEIEDDVSTSTGDQLVPMSVPRSLSDAAPAQPLSIPRDEVIDTAVIDAITTDEPQMRPLIVTPHTIVLKYHRKVPPFKNTIAGRLDAAHIADMSISRARHSRVGFGANCTLAFVTSYDSIAERPKAAELCDLDKYTMGRGERDWSEPVVARLALQQADPAYDIQEILGRHLQTLFEHSEFTEEGSAHYCPRLRLLDSPRERRAALQGLLTDAEMYRAHKQRFGVTGAYCYEVWTLCDALWGADLENDGVPGTDDLSVVNRHRKFLEWMTSAVADITDEELSRPAAGETEDENDCHSATVWTLLLGGRTLEACKLAREKGDLNMATLIAQAAGDPTFRSLIKRQLSLWRECGADALISSHKLATLRLIAGDPPIDHLSLADWRHALHATARYLCPQVPSLEQILRTYEGFFTASSASASKASGAVEAEEAVDLTTVPADMTGMQFPLPPYTTDYDLVVNKNGKQRRVLDLRYELIRARALNSRPAVEPGNYTRDPLDYGLCFVVSTWLGSAPSAAARVAEQLEARGAWHLAVHALCYHPRPEIRSHLIRNVLSRNAPAKADTPELKARLELMKKLRIPEKWLLLAQAHRAKYERLPSLEAEYLVAAEQWNAAHKVLLDDLLPEAVLSDNLQSIGALLNQMNDAANRNELSGWDKGGQAAYCYLHVCDEIRSLVSTAGASRGGVQARLEALRPALRTAARALAALPHRSPRSAAARAEMGARLVQLAVAAGCAPRRLAALLHQLRLPPDCTATAQHKITTDLAEQASELCIESASASPISSHHQATAAS